MIGELLGLSIITNAIENIKNLFRDQPLVIRIVVGISAMIALTLAIIAAKIFVAFAIASIKLFVRFVAGVIAGTLYGTVEAFRVFFKTFAGKKKIAEEVEVTEQKAA